MGKEILYKGTISGVMTSNPTFSVGKGPVLLTFSIKMDEKIEGIPEEIGVSFYKLMKFSWDNNLQEIILRENDRVIIRGKITSRELKAFPKTSIVLKADYIYNETLKCGY